MENKQKDTKEWFQAAKRWKPILKESGGGENPTGSDTRSLYLDRVVRTTYSSSLSLKRYPTPEIVVRKRGWVGSGSILRRRWPMYTCR